MLAFMVILAFVLDKCLGEPKKYHPLVFYGQYVNAIEKQFNQSGAKRWHGVFGYLLAVLPLLAVAASLEWLAKTDAILHLLVASLILYVAIGWQSLTEHANAIIEPLKANNLAQAQQALAMIVSRDTQGLSEKEIAKGAAESVLENGADSIFSALFWFVLLGIPGVVLYRCSNTLDAMWGYKTERFLHFGWFAARIDDALNFIPARLTAYSYALMGNYTLAIKSWKQQGTNWKSPNAGPVMAAGAGAINVSLGGAATYHGTLQQRPVLGPEETPETQASGVSISQACALINRTVILWVTIISWVAWL